HVIIDEQVPSIIQGYRIESRAIIGKDTLFHRRPTLPVIVRPGFYDGAALASGKDLQRTVTMRQYRRLNGLKLFTFIQWTYLRPGFSKIWTDFHMHFPPIIFGARTGN